MITSNLKKLEFYFTNIIIALLISLPVLEVVARFFGTTAITSSRMVVQHLTLWVGFFGAVLASSRGKLLSLSSSNLFEPENSFSIKHFIAKSTSLIILISLFWGSLQLVSVEYQYPVNISPLISRWFAQSIMPISLMLMLVILFFKSYSSLKNKFALLISILLFLSIVSIPQVRESSVTLWFSFFSIIFSLFYGLPIFLGLGGIAALLFWFDWTPLSAISAETYRVVVSPTLPTIPLFTIAGFLLAESKSSIRLLSLFQALFGWIPGGTPIVLVIICGFFTAITGGSGVTILALGGLLMLYGVTAGVSIKSIFLGGIIPGLLILVIVASWAIFSSKRQSVAVYGFKINNIKSALIESKWEIAIPFIIMFGIFGGYMTLVETAAISALYVLFITVVIYRDISFSKVGNILIDCCALIGGVLIILGVAMGLTSYIIDAEVPMTLLKWVKTNISSKYIFLILLNVFLLIVGCMMDIFSATIIVVPLIKPIAAYFGIDPIHLAIIFIANLELGYLTPPVGMNLFLSAYRFDESMKSVYTSTMPFYFVMLFFVILITYFPILSTWLVGF